MKLFSGRQADKTRRAIKELHRDAASNLGVNDDAKDEMEILLSELQQLLVGISIMQARTLPRSR